MRKILTAILAAMLCSFSLLAFAAEKTQDAPAAAQTQQAEQTQQTEQVKQSQQAEESAGEKQDGLLEDPVEKITPEEMQRRLQKEKGDILYLNNDGEVLVYHGTAKDKGLRKRIAAAAPNGTLLRLYTNDKDTFKQMYKRLQSYEGGSRELGKYKVVTDKELEKTLADGTVVYRFWFMKVQKEQTRTVGIPIGIGIGWGGHHHRHGPWFGVGPWW